MLRLFGIYNGKENFVEKYFALMEANGLQYRLCLYYWRVREAA